MATPDYGMVYDIKTYIKHRQEQKKNLSLCAFFDQTNNGELFLIEFIDSRDNGNHVILWCRRPKGAQFDETNSTITIFDARIFDEMQDEREACLKSIHHINLDHILAMRINHERFNWNSASRTFIQE